MSRERVYSMVKELNMIPAGCHVIAGVSGGADSVALLLLLKELQSRLDFSLEVLHVEHGIRGEESLEDAAFTEALCRRLGIACSVVHVDVPGEASRLGIGLEEAARRLRYDAFRKRAAACGRECRVALAHHLDDNAETILFRMARGSGLAGMCGMDPVRRDADGMIYIRPLLGVRRSEIEAYLETMGQPYCTDSSNLTEDAARNRIRHQVLPALATVNEEAAAHIAAGGRRLAELRDYLELQVEEAYAGILLEKESGSCVISCSGLTALHPAIAKPLVLRLAEEATGSRRDLAEVHVESILQLAAGQSGKKLLLPGGGSVQKDHDRMTFQKKTQKREENEEGPVETSPFVPVEFVEDRAQICFGGVNLWFKIADFDGDMEKIPKNRYNKWFDYDKIKNGLVVRYRRQGDYLICGSRGMHKKLSRYMIDEKIPGDRRDAIPLLAQGSEILWVLGGRIGDNYKVSENTGRILQVCCDNKEERDGFFSTL